MANAPIRGVRHSADANGTANVGGANTYNGRTVVGGGTGDAGRWKCAEREPGQLRLNVRQTDLAMNAPASDNKKDGFEANKTGAEGKTETRTFHTYYADAADVANKFATLSKRRRSTGRSRGHGEA